MIQMSKSEDERRGQILSGSLQDLPCLDSKMVRIFVSSTFTDMFQERNYLLENCYPKLKQVCREKYGLEFQIVDMRWGVRREAQDDHMTSALCLQEIENCKQLSIGPHFMALLGQKYGYRPFPAIINAVEFENLLKMVASQKDDVSLLNTWFKKDLNNEPPQYCLQPISTALPHFVNSDNQELQKEANEQWWTIFTRLTVILREAALLCVKEGKLSEREKEKYFISVTEHEIQHGILNTFDPGHHCMVISRVIENLSDHTSQSRVAAYLDMTSDRCDEEAYKCLEDLKNHKLQAALGSGKIVQHMLSWQDVGGLESSFCPRYLETLSSQVYDYLLDLIDRSVTSRQSLSRDHLLTEILQHLTLCKQRSDVFQGRDDIISSVKQYIQTDSSWPFVVHGESGSGKTSVMAKCASLVTEWITSVKPVVVIRFLGTTVESTGIRHTLKSVCQQMTATYGLESSEIPDEISSLLTYFMDVLQVASPDKPIVLFLDSLDQLSSRHHAHKLKWLPRHLPPNVKVIVSTLPVMHSILETLKKLVPVQSNFAQVSPLGGALSIDILSLWLKLNNRCLNSGQTDIVKEAFDNCSLPLYTKLVFDETLKWKSYFESSKTNLENSVQSILHKLFENLEKENGLTLVSHALGYLTASQTGLSEIELEDMLSLDDKVLNDVFVWWLPPIRRIPPLLWTRIKHKLQGYLVDKEADGISVVYWYHRQFIEVATSRYLEDQDQQQWIHSSMVDYFEGVWGGGAKKPFSFSDQNLMKLKIKDRNSEADRKVPSQPIIFSRSHDGGHVYNLRKLSQLPRHLMKSERKAELRNHLLDVDWLHAKLKALSLQDLLSDFNLYLAEQTNDQDIQLVMRTIRIAGWTLNNNPDNLTFEISGRLAAFYDSSKDIKRLIDQCDAISSRKPRSLIPPFQIFDAPKEELVSSLESHKQMLAWSVFTHDGKTLISVGLDKQINFWDVATGEKMMSLTDSFIADQKSEVIINSTGDRFIVDSYVHPFLNIYDMETLEKTVTIEATKSVDLNDTIVSQTYMFYREAIFKIYTGEKVSEPDAVISRKDQHYMSACFTPDEKYLILGISKTVVVADVATGRTVYEKVCPNVASHIEVLPCSQTAVTGHSLDHLLFVWDLKNADTFANPRLLDRCVSFPDVQFIEGSKNYREVRELSISKDGKRILANMTRAYLIVWKVESFSAVMMDGDAIDVQTVEERKIYHSCFNHDGSLVLAAQMNKILVWLSTDGAPLHTLTVCETMATGLYLSPTENTIATHSKDASNVVNIWSLDNIKMRSGTTEVDRLKCQTDVLYVAEYCGLAFVKQYIPIHMADGYLYFDSFSIEMWDIFRGPDATGTSCRSTLLPFGKYGSLNEFYVSRDGTRLFMLIKLPSIRYVCVIHLKNNECHFCEHPLCDNMLITPDGRHFVTYSVSAAECHLWSSETGTVIEKFTKCRCPRFLTDGSYLVLLHGKSKMVSYNLSAHTSQSVVTNGVLDQIWATSCQRIVTVSRDADQKHCVGSLVDIPSGTVVSKPATLSSDGLCAISPSGSLVVDNGMNVWNLSTGSHIWTVDHSNENIDESTNKLMRCFAFTSDEKHMVCTNNYPLDYVQVVNASNGAVLSSVCLHSTSCNLTLIRDQVLVSGLKDGRIVVLGLSTKASISHDHASQRRRHIIGDFEVYFPPPVSDDICERLTHRVSSLMTISLQSKRKSNSKSCKIL